MKKRKVYLDYAATTPLHPEALKAMTPFFTRNFGNPLSVHEFGLKAKIALDKARVITADSLNARPDEIVFTSGGTESNNMAIMGTAYALEKKGNHIITSSIEHHAVLEPYKFLGKRGFKITYLPVDKDGLVDPEDVKKAITSKTILVSIMHANNEVGTIEPIEKISHVLKEKEVYFHTDAVQTVGHLEVNVKKLGVNLLSLSAHKFYGPKGVGALYVRKGTKIMRYLHGGDQERMKRSGTHNIPGIVGLAKALEICGEDLKSEMKKEIFLRDRLTKGILNRVKGFRLNGHPIKRLPGNVHVGIKSIRGGIEGESILLSLDTYGIAASTGSACTSSRLEPSHVLLAMGIDPETAHGSIRFSLGMENTKEDIDYVLEVFPEVIKKLRSLSPF